MFASFSGRFSLGNFTFTAASNTLTISDGTGAMTAALSAAAQQCLVFVKNTSGCKLYLDGNLAASEALTFTAGAFAITSGSGRISRIKAFNFDISASGAEYTLVDYQNGSDEPPSIKGGSVIYSGKPSADF